MITTKFSEADYLALNHVFAGGDITKASKQDLERYTVMLSRPRAADHFGASNFPHICETVRLLLAARTSDESSRRANRISIIALVISAFAFMVTFVQAIFDIRPLLSSPIPAVTIQAEPSTSLQPAPKPKEK